MAADVAERAQLSVVPPKDQDRLVPCDGGQVAARVPQVCHVPGVLPGPLEQPVELALEDGRIRVEARVQGAERGCD